MNWIEAIVSCERYCPGTEDIRFGGWENNEFGNDWPVFWSGGYGYIGKPAGGIGGGGCMGGGNCVTPGGINIWFGVGGGGGIDGGGGGGGIVGSGGLVDGSGGGRFKGDCGNNNAGGVGGGGKYFWAFCDFGGTLETDGLIPGGMGNNCLTGKVFGVVINFTFFVIAACIACSGVSTTIKTMIRITLKNYSSKICHKTFLVTK